MGDVGGSFLSAPTDPGERDKKPDGVAIRSAANRGTQRDRKAPDFGGESRNPLRLSQNNLIAGRFGPR
jgi:hypothetical protein